MNGLLPCPFCGGEAEIVKRDVEPQGDSWYGQKIEQFPACKTCGCTLFNGYFHSGFWEDGVEPLSAIAAWNRRAPATAPVTREEVARAMCCPSGCAAQRYGNACRVGLLKASDVNVFAAADAILALLNRGIAT